MIKRKCPRCGQEVTLDEQRYHEGSTVIRQCPQCGGDVEFTIAAVASGTKNRGTNNGADPKKKKTGWIIVGALACLVVGVVVGLFLKPTQHSQGQSENGDVVVTDSISEHTDKVVAELDATESIYETIIVGTASFRMVRVAGGTFTMGATSEQGDDAYDDEYPTHQVTLSSYWIGETEVTQLLWKEVMGDNPSRFKGNNLPVDQVSYDDVQQFIQRLNQRTGRRFRLPTEAEWEYAARGGRNSRGYKYSGSNSIGNVAWYNGNSNSQTHLVKQKQPNELGLYDMSGNVCEWCSDWHGAYGSASQTVPQGATSGSCRMLRGGSWHGSARCCRSSFRFSSVPGIRTNYFGFRLALSE